jgi:hypothetical protein
VDRGQRRGIPNFDTFLALNFSMADVTVISDVKLSSIPVKISIFYIHTYMHSCTYIELIIYFSRFQIGESMPSLMKR